MKKFLARFDSKVTGVVSGFDRLVFQGILPRLIRPLGMYYFLRTSGVRLLDFRSFVQKTTEQIRRAAEDEARRLDRPMRYLRTARESKETLARQILAEKPISEGLICMFTALEPCMTFEYERSKDRGQRGLKLYPGKCLHLYKYWIDPVFGFMSGRFQTWFPFQIQICLNGREWLAHQLGQNRTIRFTRNRNCLPSISDIAAAQRLLDDQLKTHWPTSLDRIARMLNPLHDEIFKTSLYDYYWLAHQTEWATDVMFSSPAALSAIYESLTRFAMVHFKSPDVMRFLAEKTPGNYTGEIITSFKHRAEGVRIKHWQSGNSIKMYDKAGSVLRVETTIGNPEAFKVYRSKSNGPADQFEWLPLRKGVADLHRRAEVSQRSNTVYLDALSTVEDTTPCSKLFDTVSRPVFNPHRARALRLGDPADLALLETISRGEFATAGFRNRDIRRHLFASAATPDQDRRLAAKTGRLLRLLRAHKIIYKIQHTNRYRLTAHGQRLAAALFAARGADISSLLKLAA